MGRTKHVLNIDSLAPGLLPLGGLLALTGIVLAILVADGLHVLVRQVGRQNLSFA